MIINAKPIIVDNKLEILDPQIDGISGSNKSESVGIKGLTLEEKIRFSTEFLINYYQGIFGYSYLWCNNKSTKHKVTIPFRVDDRTDISNAVKKAQNLNAQNYDIYFGVNVGSKPTDENHRYTDADITWQVSIVADIDITAAGHHKENNLAPNIDTAKNFLPIQPTFLIHTGGGVQAYYKFAAPRKLSTDDEKNSAKLRGKNFLEVIRSRAKGFGGIDAVQDLPRVLRLPYTYNCKDPENKKLCTILFSDGDTVTIKQIDALICDYTAKSTAKGVSTNDAQSRVSDHLTQATTDFDRALALAALDAIPTAETAVNGGSDWLAVNSACKNLGFDKEVDEWNKRDLEHYDELQNKRRYDSLNDSSFGLHTLIGIAKRYGFDVAAFKRKWLNEHPQENADNLKNQLHDAKQKLADFDAEKSAAIETLKNVENFDAKTVFADEIINAAAFAKIFDRQAYSSFCLGLKLFGDKNPAQKVAVNDFKATVKERVSSILEHHNELKAAYAKIKGEIDTKKFFSDNQDLQMVIPEGYSLSADNGIISYDDKGVPRQICPNVIIIKGLTKDINAKTYKLILQYWTHNNAIKMLPAVAVSTVFNAQKIVSLSDYGLPVSSAEAVGLTKFLNAFKSVNDDTLPLTCTVPRCGWYQFGDTDVFVDPRRNCTITDDGKDCPLIVDNTSTFAQSLTTKGTVDNWIKAYDLAKSSPVARLTVAAAVAPPLLKILGERNFLLYIHAHTRAGKTTAMFLGASAVGSEKLIRSFDATKNGLLGAAADVNDYAFLVDEKEQADSRLKEQISLTVYALANGIGRTKLNKDSTLKKLDDWRTIAVMTGETQLLADNFNGGTFTRCLQLHAPNTILDAETCKQIRRPLRTRLAACD